MNINKRIISLVLCCIMLFTAFPVTDINEIIPSIKASATDTNNGTVYFGDLNENGKIEASDARLILQAAAHLRTLTDRQLQLADINQDNKITATDARNTLRTAARLEDPKIFEAPEIITQGEYIKNLMSELGLSGTGTSEQFFENITPENDYFESVQAAVEWGIIDADSDFDPDKEATVDFAVNTAENALEHINLPEDAELIDNNTNKKDDCNTNVAADIIQKAKDYKINEKPEKEFESIEIKETVETFDSSEITAISDNEFTFNSYGDEKPEVGDVFISESENGQTAEKIVSVTDNGNGSYSVTTVQPNMDEVFDDFSFIDTATPEIDEISFTPAAGAFISDNTDVFEQVGYARNKDNEDIFSLVLNLNSSNDPDLLPDMTCKLSSDYIDALNITAENKNVPTMKKILEDYNQKIDMITGNDGKTTVVATPVKKYESGWSLEVALRFSNFEVNFDFKDFWTTGNYSINFSADMLERIKFDGNFSAQKHLGTLHFTHGINRLLFKVDIDIYAYIDINGNVTIAGTGRIDQTYGNYDGKTDNLNNNAFEPHLEANATADAGLKFCPEVSTLGFELAEIGIQIGLHGTANVNARPLVEYKDKLYYYAGDALNAPEELNTTIFGCLNLEIHYPIISVDVAAGEDVKKQIEKLKKKNEEIPNIPLDHTFKICTLDKDSLLTPLKSSIHFELTESVEIVEKCTAEDYETLANRCSGYVVSKDTDKLLADATVQIIDKDSKVLSEAKTDKNGEFDLRFIPYGDYSVKIISDGTEITLDEKVKIDQNESDIGKLEFMIDYVKIYADYIKNLGKSRKIFQDLTDSKTTFYYCDSAICKLEKDADYPQLIVYYYDSDVYDSIYQHFPYNHFEVYSIENGKVVKKHQFQICTVYGSTQVDIWKDPKTLNQVLTCYKYTEGDKFNVVYPNEKLIYEYTWGMNAPYYATGYKNYIYSTDILTYVNAYSKYTLKNTTCDYIRIAVIDDNGKVETKTFSF